MTKILLVEDDKSLREIYGVRLLAEGYDIISAGDGEAALAMAIKDRPALIVSDVMMPKISGFDMLDILRSTTETKNIKVIMMTALSSDDQRQRGEDLGADKYLVKSQVGIEDVVRAVHEVLGDAPSFGGNSSNTPTPASTPASNNTPAAGPAAPATPTPAPAPRPAAAPVPPRSDAPAPTTTASAPSAPAASTTNESSLPQPTAPFSTPRTGGGLADRVINPIERENEPSPDVLADQIAKELGAATPDTQEEAAPVAEPAAAPAAPAEAPQPAAPEQPVSDMSLPPLPSQPTPFTTPVAPSPDDNTQQSQQPAA